MISQDPVIVYDSLQDLYRTLGLDVEADSGCYIFRIEDVHRKPVSTPLFRANYYTFLFIASGRGRYTLGHQEYTTRPYTIYFANPGHLKSYQTYEPYTGYMVAFTEDFLKRHVHREVFHRFPFLLAEIAPPNYVSPQTYDVFCPLLKQLLQEVDSTSPYRRQIVGSLLVVLLLKIKEHFGTHYEAASETGQHSIVGQFKRDLEQTYRELEKHTYLPNVQEYAQLQQLHPNYFSTVIKNKTGKSVNTWIHEKTMSEAQALLKNTALPIKEIAAQLKFKATTNFSKFFKKHSSMTPQNFRQQHPP